mmetsp:Transcript_21922/g.32856  ORF Transcript_21922/g.32856 Transcript_21922/m.32856 type:complete len:553 (-) Transcript_21922:183-1841(-)
MNDDGSPVAAPVMSTTATATREAAALDDHSIITETLPTVQATAVHVAASPTTNTCNNGKSSRTKGSNNAAADAQAQPGGKQSMPSIRSTTADRKLTLPVMMSQPKVRLLHQILILVAEICLSDLHTCTTSTSNSNSLAAAEVKVDGVVSNYNPHTTTSTSTSLSTSSSTSSRKMEPARRWKRCMAVLVNETSIGKVYRPLEKAQTFKDKVLGALKTWADFMDYMGLMVHLEEGSGTVKYQSTGEELVDPEHVGFFLLVHKCHLELNKSDTSTIGVSVPVHYGRTLASSTSCTPNNGPAPNNGNGNVNSCNSLDLTLTEYNTCITDEAVHAPPTVAAAVAINNGNGRRSRITQQQQQRQQQSMSLLNEANWWIAPAPFGLHSRKRKRTATIDGAADAPAAAKDDRDEAVDAVGSGVNANANVSVNAGMVELADSVTDLTDGLVHVMTRSIAVQREKALLDRQEYQAKILKHSAETEVCKLQKQSLLVEQERADLELLGELEEKIALAKENDAESSSSSPSTLCVQWEKARDRCLKRLNARDADANVNANGRMM